jgi:hypothetical protein
MSTVRTRSLLAVLAAASIIGYGIGGHALPMVESHDGMAGAGAGLCLLLAVGVACAVALRPQAQSFPVPLAALPITVDRVRERVVDQRARASPVVLQRFRN